ncbi:mRNA-degrading endonuclease [Candidatus Giovannonibacteria bacterium RIFCSPLOWO2_02_44_8]|uniref:mRNA-degrading endonuclease n=1 Tax=Candidatus Giovannonibacteria bacterium RIFCSPLOWO2_02_44_8 TaxID=1798355 RepID=A0A1F5XEQ3_9BACT|nr:MAG: mRNA-degrading endonuclease [Candidatus Giovannonibacteria bacterium RIFCSPLOWO2_02_44_8]
MVDRDYIPERGDIVWLDFSPTLGREQRGKRPAVVISSKIYNERSGLALVCPITSKAKGYNFEVEVIEKKITGVALADHARSLDWKIRNPKFITKLAPENFREIISKLTVLIISA